jgi:3-oxoacyl-[acyl-carrier protein] reductase
VRKLDGKVAIVTGAGRGIGQAIALKLGSEGARVVVNDLEEGAAAETVAAVRNAGGEASACAGSVTDPAFPGRLVAATLETFGGLDIVVNNAGYSWDGVIQNMTDEQFQAMLDVHVTGPFRILRAAAEPIRRFAKAEAQAGREVFRKVVNISSVSALGGNPGQVNYAAGKAAIIGMTRTLAKEWGRYRVNVNCVAFGFIGTRMTQPLSGGGRATIEVAGRQVPVGVQPALLDDLATRMIPLGRLGTPAEAANGVYLFCIPESDYISGQVITVGGGIRF